MQPDSKAEGQLNLAVLRLKDLNSIDIAESTRLLHEVLGERWLIEEIDDDEDHHLSWELITVGIGIVQCALAGVSVWLQARANSSAADEKKIYAEMARIAESLAVPPSDLAHISKAIASSSENIILELSDYEIRVRKTRRFEYVVSGKRKKRK